MRRNGELRQLSPLSHIPTLKVGQTYLLFVTRPSKIGLSTTVGLGQGAFRIIGKPGAETAVNEFNNLGLFNGMESSISAQAETTARSAAAPAPSRTRGPVAYSELAAQIRSIVGGK